MNLTDEQKAAIQALMNLWPKDDFVLHLNHDVQPGDTVEVTRSWMLYGGENSVCHTTTADGTLDYPKLPMPNDLFEGGVIVASCWQSDDPGHEFGVWATVLLLMPEEQFYMVMNIEPNADEAWKPKEYTSRRHPNIIPAAEDYSDTIGGY